MGNQSSQPNFINDQWQLVDKTITHSVWRNRKQPSLHIEQHDKFVTDDYTYSIDRDIFQFRHNNPFLVAGVFSLENQLHQFCSTNYKYRQFIEAIPIRLSDIQQIPFPDTLHLYYQCLHGFHLLAQKLNYFFEVESSYIGINQRSVVKVWMSKYLANHSTVGSKISQELMVKGLIDILDRSSAPFQPGLTIPTVRNFLYRNSDTLKFDEAKRELQTYIRNYHSSIVPSKLECIERAGGVYFIANRQTMQHSKQPLVQSSYNPDWAKSKSKNQLEHGNNSQFVANISNNQPTKLPQKQQQYMPFAPLVSTPSQTNSKKNQNISQINQQKPLYFTPPANRDLQIHRRSDNKKQFFQLLTNSPSNNTKVSQNLQQERLIQTNQLKISKDSFPIQGIKQMDSSLRPPQNEPQNVLRLDAQKRFSHVRNVSQPSQQIKGNIQHGYLPSLSFQNHSAVDNPSLRPNLTGFHSENLQNNVRAQVPAPLNQKMLPTAVSPQFSTTNKQIQNNSFNLKAGTIAIAQNQIASVKEKNNTIAYNKQKEADLNPLAKEHIPQSYNASSSKSAAATELQKSLAKDYTPEVNRFQTKNHSQKKTNPLNLNDGKSSDQFLRQLRLINQSFKYNQRSESSFAHNNSPSYSVLQNRNNDYPSKFNQDRSKDFYQESNLRSYKEVSNTAAGQAFVDVQPEEFGRNAVSNIIQNQDSSYKNINTFANNQPFKFQQGLTLKYSILEPDQAQQNQFKKQSYVKYENPIDFRLMTDLNATKK